MRIFMHMTLIAIILIMVSAGMTAQVNRTGSKKILAIGDSNGAPPDGWVSQLKKIRTNDSIYNTSVPGNTIGFNNLNNPSLNTLINIDRYLDDANRYMGQIDEIIIMLGTNDCKAVFRDSLSAVPQNLKKLIYRIRQYTSLWRVKPTIFLVSPPPCGPEEVLQEKYRGSTERVASIQQKFHDIAGEENAIFIDIYQILYPVFRYLSPDGIHLTVDGQRMIALIIQENLKFFDLK